MIANFGQLLADAWERACALTEYIDFRTNAMTIGWHRGEAYVHLWNYRTNKHEWRRFPQRDTKTPPTAQRRNYFSDYWLKVGIA